MKVVHVSTYNAKGGASIACSRLHKALTGIGVDSNMLVMEMQSPGQHIFSTTQSMLKRKYNFFRLALEKLVFIFFQKDASVRFQFSLANTGENICRHSELKKADIIHLHWINHGYISLRGLRSILATGKPVLWTFHDMWAFTGGCHHSYECYQYEHECGNCPYLRSPNKKDISNRIWKKKRKILGNYSINTVCVGTWLGGRAKNSSLLKNKSVTVIPNCLDASVFNRGDKTEIRKKLNLPVNGNILLFGSVRLDDPVKGWSYMSEALQIILKRNPDYTKNLSIILLGNTIKDKTLLAKIPVPYYCIGNLKDDISLSEVYSAADATIVSSLYETFSLVACESLSCGVPVVAFDHSGPQDIIDHKKSGYLAVYKSASDLAEGIMWCLSEENKEIIQNSCRKKVLSDFSYEAVAGKYLQLYQSVLKPEKK